MKNFNSNIIATLFAVMIFASSCNEEVLDVNKTDALSDQAVWSSEKSADMYVTASYKIFTDFSQVVNSRTRYFDSYSDIMKSTSWEMYNHPYNKALQLPSAFSKGGAGAFECWSDLYGRIRRANVLLADVDRYGEKKFGKEWCDIRRAEARLCRAYAYYLLVRVYGGVPIRTETSGVNGVDDGAYEEDIDRKRSTEAESWNFVISELQWAAERLPYSWPAEWKGRATRRTAYGLISRMALYAKNWDLVIAAADSVKNMGGALAPDYAKVFQVDGGQDNSNELLFALYYLQGTVTHNFDRYNRPFGDNAVYTTEVYAEHVPTAELADLYEFADGTPFDWKTYTTKYADPFANREPRFKATILYNGATWEGRIIQTYIGGSDAFSAYTQSGATNGHTCTGYYLRKYLQEGNTEFLVKYSYQYDAVLRYAEVLLNKAEAYAEADFARYKLDALAALNELRTRVKLPSKTAADAPDKDTFMSLLRKERTVELAGEGHRYWDLRRWKLAESVINGKLAHGVRITRSGTGALSYETVDCDAGVPRIFLEKYYYFSLPESEVVNNKLCEDNPYW
jgi:hypothetical protein